MRVPVNLRVCTGEHVGASTVLVVMGEHGVCGGVNGRVCAGVCWEMRACEWMWAYAVSLR